MPGEEVDDVEGAEDPDEEPEETIEDLFDGEPGGGDEEGEGGEREDEGGADVEEPKEGEDGAARGAWDEGAGEDGDVGESEEAEEGGGEEDVDGAPGGPDGEEAGEDDEEAEDADVSPVDAGASGNDGGPLAYEGEAEPPEPVAGGADGGRLSTGIEALDHHLGGGIPPGRIVSFVATADTQSELLVKQLASQHDCLYLSTLRPKWEVQEEVTDYIQKQVSDGSDQRVRIEQLPADSRLDAARRHVEELDSRSVVVIDSANELESSETDRYAYFIDDVKRALWDTGSVGLFYCIEEEQPPAGRAITLRRADVVWRLRQSEDVGGIRHELLVSKFRGGRALIEPLTLWLTDEVLMDDGSAAT